LAMLHKNGVWDWLWEKDSEEETEGMAPAAAEGTASIGEAVEI